MFYVILTVLILFFIITRLIYLDIILSFLVLIGIRFRPKLLSDIIDPMYNFVDKIFYTKFGGLYFTPLIILLIVFFFESAISIVFNNYVQEINNLIN